MAVKVFNDQTTQSEFELGKSRGSTSGLFGDAIKFKIDSDDPAQPYVAPSRTAGVIDLTQSTSWSLNPIFAKQDLVSYTIKLFQPKYSSVITNLFTNISQGLQLADQNLGEGFEFDKARKLLISNPYANMLIADDLKWTIKLPMLSLLPQTYATQFGDGENEGSNPVSQILGNVSNFFQNSPLATGGGTGILGKTFGAKTALGRVVKSSVLGNLSGVGNSLARAIYPSVNATKSSDRFYRGSNPIGYPLSFDLINTFDTETTKRNIEFVRFMSYMASARSRNKFIEDSPVVGEAEIGGLRFAPIIKFDFEYQGQGNFLYVDGEPIPEAYTCTLTVQEMLPHYRNLQHEYIHNGRKLRAINTDPRTLCDTINQGIDVIGNISGSVF